MLQVNNKKLWGLSHVQVLSILKELPQNVIIVCARQRDVSVTDSSQLSHSTSLDRDCEASNIAEGPATSNLSVSSHAHDNQHQLTLSSVSDINVDKKDLEPLNELSVKPLGRPRRPSVVTWNSDIEVVVLNKGDSGLGFSILDYQVITTHEKLMVAVK